MPTYDDQEHDIYNFKINHQRSSKTRGKHSPKPSQSSLSPRLSKEERVIAILTRVHGGTEVTTDDEESDHDASSFRDFAETLAQFRSTVGRGIEEGAQHDHDDGIRSSQSPPPQEGRDGVIAARHRLKDSYMSSSSEIFEEDFEIGSYGKRRLEKYEEERAQRNKEEEMRKATRLLSPPALSHPYSPPSHPHDQIPINNDSDVSNDEEESSPSFPQAPDIIPTPDNSRSHPQEVVIATASPPEAIRGDASDNDDESPTDGSRSDRDSCSDNDGRSGHSDPRVSPPFNHSDDMRVDHQQKEDEEQENAEALVPFAESKMDYHQIGGTFPAQETNDMEGDEEIDLDLASQAIDVRKDEPGIAGNRSLHGEKSGDKSNQLDLQKYRELALSSSLASNGRHGELQPAESGNESKEQEAEDLVSVAAEGSEEPLFRSSADQPRKKERRGGERAGAIVLRAPRHGWLGPDEGAFALGETTSSAMVHIPEGAIDVTNTAEVVRVAGERKREGNKGPVPSSSSCSSSSLVNDENVHQPIKKEGKVKTPAQSKRLVVAQHGFGKKFGSMRADISPSSPQKIARAKVRGKMTVTPSTQRTRDSSGTSKRMEHTRGSLSSKSKTEDEVIAKVEHETVVLCEREQALDARSLKLDFREKLLKKKEEALKKSQEELEKLKICIQQELTVGEGSRSDRQSPLENSTAAALIEQKEVVLRWQSQLLSLTADLETAEAEIAKLRSQIAIEEEIKRRRKALLRSIDGVLAPKASPSARDEKGGSSSSSQELVTLPKDDLEGLKNDYEMQEKILNAYQKETEELAKRLKGQEEAWKSEKEQWGTERILNNMPSVMLKPQLVRSQLQKLEQQLSRATQMLQEKERELIKLREVHLHEQNEWKVNVESLGRALKESEQKAANLEALVAPSCSTTIDPAQRRHSRATLASQKNNVVATKISEKERRLQAKEEGDKKTIRAIRQEHQRLKAAYEKQIADFQAQLAAKMVATNETSRREGSTGDVTEKRLEEAQARVAELKSETQHIRGFYQKILEDKAVCEDRRSVRASSSKKKLVDEEGGAAAAAAADDDDDEDDCKKKKGDLLIQHMTSGHDLQQQAETESMLIINELRSKVHGQEEKLNELQNMVFKKQGTMDDKADEAIVDHDLLSLKEKELLRQSQMISLKDIEIQHLREKLAKSSSSIKPNADIAFALLQRKIAQLEARASQREQKLHAFLMNPKVDARYEMQLIEKEEQIAAFSLELDTLINHLEALQEHQAHV